MKSSQGPIHSDPEILGGALVFRGTRAPAQALVDYLQTGRSLEEFLDDFPCVTRKHVEAVLKETK